MHVVALAPWVGGLLLLVWHAAHRGDHLGVAAQRFSRMALWCFIAVGRQRRRERRVTAARPRRCCTPATTGGWSWSRSVLFTVLGVVRLLAPRAHAARADGAQPQGLRPAAVSRTPWAFTRLAGGRGHPDGRHPRASPSRWPAPRRPPSTAERTRSRACSASRCRRRSRIGRLLDAVAARPVLRGRSSSCWAACTPPASCGCAAAATPGRSAGRSRGPSGWSRSWPSP